MPLIRKLEYGAELTDSDRDKLRDLVKDPRPFAQGVDVISHCDAPSKVHVVMEGLACRYKLMPDGGRSIMALLLPGDFCDMNVAILGQMDHSIATLAPSMIAEIAPETIEDLLDSYPRITRAMWWATLVDEATLRESIANISRRAAVQRLAHLFCEVHARLDAVGLVDEGQFRLPLTQTMLGDILGLSAVHVNRVLQQLRKEGLVAVQEERFAIADVGRLRLAADFDGDYLHFDRPWKRV